MTPEQIESWQSYMRSAASRLDMTAQFPAPHADMLVTFATPDGRAINMKVHNGQVHLLPSPNINMDVRRMFDISKVVTKAHKKWTKDNT